MLTAIYCLLTYFTLCWNYGLYQELDFKIAKFEFESAKLDLNPDSSSRPNSSTASLPMTRRISLFVMNFKITATPTTQVRRPSTSRLRRYRCTIHSNALSSLYRRCRRLVRVSFASRRLKWMPRKPGSRGITCYHHCAVCHSRAEQNN